MLQLVGLAGLGASLAINSYRTLRLLDLSLTVVGDDHDSLSRLNRELRFIAGNNILEMFQLDVVVQVGASCRTESEDWSAFDSLLTEPGAFPMLRQVFVEVMWVFFAYRDEDYEWQNHFLEVIKEDKFPRLVESKAVEFDFYTVIC